MNTIFVSIASYRDPECQHTVRDLFARAARPENISVGICWQADDVLDADCFALPPPKPSRVREKRYTVQESKGGCWARAEALSLWLGEDFILQIDAHMRFAQDWDKILLDAFMRCPTKRAVLSTMPPNYNPPHELQDCTGHVPLTYADRLGGVDDLQPLHLIGYLRKRELIGATPVLGAFIVGNFLFAPSAAFIKEVPFDPHIFFKGQELTYSARLWTHGYDIYQPDGVVIYHYWGSEGRAPIGGEGHYKSVSDRAIRGRARVMHLLELAKTDDPLALVEIERYGMGCQRTLAEYWQFAGIDLQAGTIEEKAKRCQWKMCQ
jgi:glycosyltransferase involved in cell wall biosynthesis